MVQSGKKRILVTGGAGFIGSHLCERFLGEGHEVFCVDNLVTGSTENIAHFRKNKSFHFLNKNISDPFKIPGRLDWVMNFASPASPPDYMREPIETLRVGAMGTFNTLEIARAKKAVYFMASTSEVYGDPLVSPQIESYWGNVNSVGPRSVYDEAKRYSEALTMGFHRHYKMDTKIIRIFNTYGRRMRPEDGRVIPNFISQALRGKPLTVYGDGSQTRSYCHVDDLVEGIVRMIRSRETGPVNLGNPHEMTVQKLAELILDMTGSKSTIVHKALPVDDPKRRCPDIALAKATLAWEPKVRLRDGLAQTIEYFREKVSKGR